MKAPSDLIAKGRGRKFWNQVQKSYDLTDSEREVLTEVCRQLDECDDLRAVVVAEGATSKGSRGQVRIHPALQELRQSRAELRRLLAELQLPDINPENKQTVPSARSIRARKAATTRWKVHHHGPT